MVRFHFHVGRSEIQGESEMIKDKNGYLFDFSAVEHSEQYCCLVHQCYVYLRKLDPWIFEYPEGDWNADEIDKKNKDLLDLLSKKEDNGIVYTINIRDDKDTGVWQKQYVGSCKLQGLRQRIREHLVNCSDSTNSCLKFVQNAVACGQTIAISWIEITPFFIYKSVEEMIIGIEKIKNKDALPWNELPGNRPGARR